MEKITITPKNVCSRLIEVEHEDGIIRHVHFTGGCAGNTQGVAALLVGRKIDEIIPLLEGIKCRGSRNGETSCPAQLAEGLKEALK